MGAGDQLYNDNLWILPALQEWLKRDDKLEYKPDKTMQEAISGYYCGAYLRHTHYHPAAPLLRNTPQVRLQSTRPAWPPCTCGRRTVLALRTHLWLKPQPQCSRCIHQVAPSQPGLRACGAMHARGRLPVSLLHQYRTRLC